MGDTYFVTVAVVAGGRADWRGKKEDQFLVKL